MSFGTDLKNFENNAGGAMLRTRRAVVIKLFSAVILDTPVGDVNGGRLRNNWQATSGAGAQGTLPDVDPQGTKAIGRISQAIGDIMKVAFLTNNLPYSHRIEFDGHSSVKAPEGMMRKNVIRFQRLLREAAFASRR